MSARDPVVSFTFEAERHDDIRKVLRSTPGVTFTDTWYWFLWRRFTVTAPAHLEEYLRGRMRAVEDDGWKDIW